MCSAIGSLKSCPPLAAASAAEAGQIAASNCRGWNARSKQTFAYIYADATDDLEWDVKASETTSTDTRKIQKRPKMCSPPHLKWPAHRVLWSLFLLERVRLGGHRRRWHLATGSVYIVQRCTNRVYYMFGGVCKQATIQIGDLVSCCSAGRMFFVYCIVGPSAFSPGTSQDVGTGFAKGTQRTGSFAKRIGTPFSVLVAASRDCRLAWTSGPTQIQKHV